MKKLYYLPLEPYIERYTYLMSCVDGWAERHFKNEGVDFVRIDGEKLGDAITTGKVVDAHGRSYYAMSQIMSLIKLMTQGEELTEMLYMLKTSGTRELKVYFILDI